MAWTVGRMLHAIATAPTQHGKFEREADGRLMGHILLVWAPRADGRIKVVHAFGSGKRITKLYTSEQVQAEIAKLRGEP